MSRRGSGAADRYSTSVGPGGPGGRSGRAGGSGGEWWDVLRQRCAGDLRLLPSAAIAWSAAAVAIRQEAFTVTAGALVAVALSLVIGCVVFLVPTPARRSASGMRSLQFVFAPAATAALILLTTGGSLARVEAGPVGEAIRTGSPFTAILTITGEPSSLGPGAFGGGDRVLVDADITGGLLNGDGFAAATPVVVLGTESWADVGTGDVVRVLGSVGPTDRVGEARGVFLPATAPDVQPADGWLGSTDDLRDSFRHVSLKDDRDGGLLPGMAIGDRIPLDPGLEEDMKTTGLTHLTAVSGANCSYVVAFTFLGLRMVRFPRMAASVGAVVALAAFVLLVRPEPSVLRAAVMGAIGVGAVLSGRGRVSLTLLLLSIIVLLAVDPWLSVSFAFMLSVAATLGLVTVGPLVVRVLTSLMPRTVAQLLAIPLTAQVFCTPILVLLQPELPVYSLPANVLAAPVVPSVTLLGMAAVVALIGAPVLAPPLVTAAQWGTRWVAWVAEIFADSPAASVPWPSGAPGALLAAALSLGLLLALAFRDARGIETEHEPLTSLLQRVRGGRGGSRAAPSGGTSVSWSGPPGAGTGRRPVGGSAGFPRERGTRKESRARPGEERDGRSRQVLLLCVVVVVAVVIGGVLFRRMSAPPAVPWLLAMCDVGQGDGIVVQTTPGHALVVDAGPDPAAMDTCLDSLQVDVIDALVVTHLHDDHYGGILGAVQGREVGGLFYSSGEDGLPDEVLEAASAAGVEPQLLSDTTALDLPPLDVDVLWPTTGAPSGEENNASAVLHIAVPMAERQVTLLLTGDLEEDATARLLSDTPALADGVDILKIAHHGARNGGSAVIGAVGPALAVISVGEGNDYSHPHQSILDALATAGVATARTDELGSFTVGVEDGRLDVRPLP